MSGIIDCFNLKSPNHTIRITKRCNGVDLDIAITLNDLLPKWTTAGRPLNPVEPNLGYNLTTHEFEYWNGTEWSGLGNSGTDPDGNILTIVLSGDTLSVVSSGGDTLVVE